MFCEKCGMQLQEADKFCPNCGTPAAVDETPASEGTQSAAVQPESVPQVPPVMGAAGNVADAGNVAGAGNVGAAGNVAATGNTAGAGNVGVAGNAAATGNIAGAGNVGVAGNAADAGNVGAAGTNGLGAANKPGEDTPEKKKKTGAILAGVAAAVVLVVIIVIASGITSRIGNLFHKTFNSPEKYYQYVEKKTAKELSENLGEMYQSYILSRKNLLNSTTSTEITLKLDEGGKDYLELAGLLGMDLSWLDSITINGEVTINDDKLGMSLSSSINKDKLVSYAMAADMEEGEVFLQIPELTSTYMGLDMKDVLGSYRMKEMTGQWKDFKAGYADAQDTLPSQAKLEKLLNKYLKIALGRVGDVKKKNKSLKVEGVEQSCTVLEVTLNSRTMADMLDAVLDEAEVDKELEDYIVSMAEVFGGDADDAYDEFLDDLEDMYYDLRSNRGGNEIVLTVYVNGKGEIIGREVESNGVTIAYLMPKKGKKFGYELSVTRGSQSFSLTGSGKYSGNKMDGEFRLRYNGTSLVDITTDNLNVNKLSQGQLNGKIEMRLGSGIGTMMTNFVSSSFSSLRDMKLTINAKSSSNSWDYTVSVANGDEKLGSVSINSKYKKASSVKIPKGKNVVFVEDLRDFEDWLDTIKWNKVIANLEKTDLPRSMTRSIEDFIDILEDGDFGRMQDMFNSLMWNYYYMF